MVESALRCCECEIRGFVRNGGNVARRDRLEWLRAFRHCPMMRQAISART
jgi:hypothetical protein